MWILYNMISSAAEKSYFVLEKRYQVKGMRFLRKVEIFVDLKLLIAQLRSQGQL